MARETDLSSETILLEDKIFEKHATGPVPNTADGVTLKIMNDLFKVPHENLQNTLKEHCVLVSHTTPTTSLAPDSVSTNTFMLKLSDHQVVHSKHRRRKYSQYKVPVPGTVLSSVPQTLKLSHTNRDCVKSVNSTANIHNPDDGKAESESSTSCLSTFHNGEQVLMNSQCGSRTTLTEERPSPLSGNKFGSYIRGDHTGDFQCPQFMNSNVKTDDLQKTQRHGDSETATASSMPHHQQPGRKQEANQIVLKPVEHRLGDDHSGRVGQFQTGITQSFETKEIPWQEEVLQPYCDCQISSFTDDMARACTISYQGFPVRLPHVGSVLIQEHQLITFVRNGKIYVSICELKSRNMIHNFTKFSSLLRSQSNLLPLAGTEVEFLKQKGRVKDSSNARLVSLDHLRWIYRTQAVQQQDAFNTAVSQCPWYSLTLGHSCRKVAMLNPTQDYVCPVCLQVEQRPIEATTQRYECDLCFQANESSSVLQTQMTKVNYASKTQKVEQTSFVVREDGKLQTVIMGQIKVAEKNVAAFCKGDVTYVSCRHLLVHLYQFPWENFVSLVKSLDLCFMEAPVMVCHFFQKLAYPQELVNGKVWCSVQNLRCIACFSVGQMNNTQYLEKNKILALIAQGKYVEEFPYDAKGGETEKSLIPPKSQVSTTNSNASTVMQASPGKTVVKVDAATGKILVCRSDGKIIGNLSLPQTAGQTSLKVHKQRGLKLDASDGQKVSGSGKIVGNLCQTRTVAQNDQRGLNVNASGVQTLAGGGDIGNLSQTQTVAQNMTKQMCVNFDGSGHEMVVGNMTTSATPSDPGIQCISGLTQRNPDEWSPIMPPNSVFCCERSEIPGGNYFVKENMKFTDYKSESGLVFRVMKQPTVTQNKIDILSIAAEEIREVASKSEHTSDMDNSGFTSTNDSCHQSFQPTSFEQGSNLQQRMSEQTTQPPFVQVLDVVPTNVGTVCKDIRTVVPTHTLSVNDNSPGRTEPDLSDGQDKLLSMPVDFFQDTPVGSPKRKCFLSPNEMHEVAKPGGHVIVFQNEGGEHYECTALGPFDELNDCLVVVSPEKAERENMKTISPDSACSQNSVDPAISDGKSHTSVGPGPAASLNQSQNSSVGREDNSSNTEQSGSGCHSEPLSAKGAKNIHSKTEQVSQVTSSVDEEYKTDTSESLEAQGLCFNVSPSTETKETEPSNMSPNKSMGTPISALNSPNKSPVISNIYKKLVTRNNSASSLSVLASVAEAIDEDSDGKDAGTDGGICKVKSLTVDSHPSKESGSVVPENDSSPDLRSNIAHDEATGDDVKESTQLLQKTQSNANSSVSAEDEDMGSELKEESSPLLQGTQSNFSPKDASSACDSEETSLFLKETESDIFTEHEVSVGESEVATPLLQAKCNNTVISDEDEDVGSDIFELACSGGSPARTDRQSNDSKTSERLSVCDTDKSNSSHLVLGGDSRSPGTSNSSIENEIEICTELDLHLESLNQKQTVEKSSSVSEEKRECSNDVGKCLVQMEDAQMSPEEVLETDLQYHQDPEEREPSVHQGSKERNTSLHHQDPEEKSISHHHQGSKDNAADLGLDARGNVDTNLVMVDSFLQLQIAEEIEENGFGNSRCFQGETEGTDLCYGGSVEPVTVADVSSMEPETAVDISSMEPETTAEGKSNKRKRHQSFHQRVKRKKTIMPEIESMSTRLNATSSYLSSKAQSKDVTVDADSPEFPVCDNDKGVPVQAAAFSETGKLPKFTEVDNHHNPEEGALFSESTQNELAIAKSPRFSSGGKNDHVSAETVNPSVYAAKEQFTTVGIEAAMEGLTEHAVEQMKHVLEKVQLDGLVITGNRLQFKLKLHPSLHTHFKGETQQTLVDMLSRLVKIGYILQQRRRTADGDEQTSTSMDS
ncbi:serine-rich adhesin for platelets-like [Haliotis asinina]|uniref:serine-rich adhesin for platelets-like n=1 Tax=Haliotis asinina TaxID=109174 RepID=UPI0035324EB7